MVLIDSTLNGDDDSLRELQEWLRDQFAHATDATDGHDPELAGRLLGLIDVSHWAIERVLPVAEISSVERSSHANRFLKELAATPGLANTELADRLGVDDTQISRLGRKLRDQGLVASRLIGRRNRWELTPKGRRTLEVLDGVVAVRELTEDSVDSLVRGQPRRAGEARPKPEPDETLRQFTSRLNRAFDTLYPREQGPRTSAEVIAALKAEGIKLSPPYLSQLRSGNPTNPSAVTMAALANFFRIKPDALTDDKYYEALSRELTWLADMRDEGVRRIAARTVGLSEQAQNEVVATVEKLRRREHAGV